MSAGGTIAVVYAGVFISAIDEILLDWMGGGFVDELRSLEF